MESSTSRYRRRMCFIVSRCLSSTPFRRYALVSDRGAHSQCAASRLSRRLSPGAKYVSELMKPQPQDQWGDANGEEASSVARRGTLRVCATTLDRDDWGQAGGRKLWQIHLRQRFLHQTDRFHFFGGIFLDCDTNFSEISMVRARSSIFFSRGTTRVCPPAASRAA